jgi:hypothetical protein
VRRHKGKDLSPRPVLTFKEAANRLGRGIDVNGIRPILILSSITRSTLFVSRGMAVGVERVFSDANELVTGCRNALDMESIQANECFRNWGATP